MLRNLFGFAIVAVLGMFALKLVLGLLGFAFSLLMSVLWLAAIGFVLYLILKLLSPQTARRVRDTIRGHADAA